MSELKQVNGIELRKLLSDKKLILGTDRVLKMLRLSKLAKVILSSNCPETDVKDINKYSSLSGTETIHANQTNEQFGLLLKKPFHISVMGVIKK